MAAVTGIADRLCELFGRLVHEEGQNATKGRTSDADVKDDLGEGRD